MIGRHAAPFNMTSPLVTAVMITGKSPSRIPFALAATRSLWDQTYCNIELLVINHGPSIASSIVDFLGVDYNAPGRVLVECVTNKGDRTIGDLRNLALDLAFGDYLVQWDDDDWSHPRRIEKQLGAAIEHGCPVTLNNQLRYDFGTGNGYIANPKLTRQRQGLPNTILFPKTGKRYPSISMDEDGCFLRELGYIHAIDNPPEWHIRFSHGDNVCSRKNIMKQFANGSNRLNMPKCSSDYLLSVVDQHYSFAKR